MLTPTFVETHNLVAFLEKQAESAGFEQIINFLKSKPIHYALTVNPTIYVSCVKQFWATAKVKKVNDQEQIQARVDKTKVIITEDNIRSDLHFDDAEGTAYLLNEAIFEGLMCMGTMASAIICLADNQKFNFSKYIFDNMVKSLEGGVKFYRFPRFLQVFLDKQDEVMARHKEMYVISSHAKKIFANMRRIRAGFSGKSEILYGEGWFRCLEDASKQERMIEEIYQNAEIALDDETQGRTYNDEMFRVDDLAGEEVVMDSAVDPVTTVKDSDVPTTDVTKDEITMAQALAALKSIKPKVVQSQIPTVSSSKDKGKAKMIEPEVPLKKKEQIRIDEEYARKLQVEEQEAARLSRAQQDEEANNS
nr:hypothetical protein [Tanacetum cinerariifolium]